LSLAPLAYTPDFTNGNGAVAIKFNYLLKSEIPVLYYTSKQLKLLRRNYKRN